MKHIKKIFAIVLAVAILSSFAGCNYNIIDVNYGFNKAYISFPDEVKIVDIANWSDDEASVTITSKDGIVYCTSYNNVILVGE